MHFGLGVFKISGHWAHVLLELAVVLSLFCGSVTPQLMVIGERESFIWESNYWHPTEPVHPSSLNSLHMTKVVVSVTIIDFMVHTFLYNLDWF